MRYHKNSFIFVISMVDLVGINGLGLKLIFGLGLPLMALPSLRQDKLINQMRQYCWTNMISECYTCHTFHTWSVRSLINSNTIISNQLRNC